MAPIIAGASSALGAGDLDVLKTISAPGVLAGAVVVAGVQASTGEDIFGIGVETVGAARDGEFDVFAHSVLGGQDTQWQVVYIAVNP